MVTQQFEQRTRDLIDSLKAICAAYGLGNDGNEFKIITQVFLYKFLNDKFAFEAKKIRPELANVESWEAAIAAMSADDVEMMQMQMGPDTARLKPEHFIAHLFGRQNAPEFAKLFDDTLRKLHADSVGNEIAALLQKDREQSLDAAARHRLSEPLLEKRNLVIGGKVSDL